MGLISPFSHMAPLNLDEGVTKPVPDYQREYKLYRKRLCQNRIDFEDNDLLPGPAQAEYLYNSFHRRKVH